MVVNKLFAVLFLLVAALKSGIIQFSLTGFAAILMEAHP